MSDNQNKSMYRQANKASPPTHTHTHKITHLLVIYKKVKIMMDENYHPKTMMLCWTDKDRGDERENILKRWRERERERRGREGERESGGRERNRERGGGAERERERGGERKSDKEREKREKDGEQEKDRQTEMQRERECLRDRGSEYKE